MAECPAPVETGVADIFRRFGDSYLKAHGPAVLASHRRAIADIIACRTEAKGGDLWCCGHCGTLVPVFHSCRNRHCGKCHGEQTQAWLEQRQAEILPVPYFHVTVTMPEELRPILRRHQIDGYGLLMKTAAEAIIELARDPRWVGGTVGVLAVLHTWTQMLHFHPHAHCLVTGGGLSDDGATWHSAGRTFLFPTKALGKLVRTRFREAFAKRCPAVDLPDGVWRRPWVVHITPWNEGAKALEYFARYAFRIAIADCRIIRMDGDRVTFRYKDREAGLHRTCTVTGHEFLRRYLQHVLPQGFHKLRYYGLWHPARRRQLENLRNVLVLDRPAEPPSSVEAPPDENREPAAAPEAPPAPRSCPQCRDGILFYRQRLSPSCPRGP